MQIILIVVTAIALAIAAGMAVVVVTMLRHERARSDARIEALNALAGEPIMNEAVRPAREPIQASRESMRPARVVAEPIALEEATDVDDLEIRPGVAGVADLFAEPERPSPWANRLVAIGCLAAIALAIGIGVTTFTSHNQSASDKVPTAAAKQAEIAPLELLALRHTQETDRLVITGLVQNPRSGAPVTHVVATVFLFSPDGKFLSSSQAPLDFTTLAPGGESPFVVPVPVAGQVARYRVGFRSEDGRVLPHVDKRGPDALAQK